MSKADGKYIAIQFTQPLINEFTGPEASAFSVTGPVYDMVPGGELIAGDFQVDTVERYPVQKLWETEAPLQLDSPGEMSITDAQCYETISGTTLTGTVSAKAGDFILATISHRSTFTTPGGWTKLYESTAALSANQKMVFAIKQVNETGTVSFTATQSSAGRIYLNLISIGGISGIESANEYEVYSETAVTSIAVPNKAAGEKLIWGCSAPSWITSNYGQWSTSPNDLELIQLPSTTQPRQLNAVDFGTGQATGRSFIPNAGSGTTIVVSAVRLLQEFSTPKISESEAIELSGEVRIKWTEDKPEDADILVEYTTGEEPGEWQEAEDGDIIEADTNLWIRVALSTENTLVTPTLTALWLEDPSAPQNVIRLVMKDLKRFHNIVGDLTVTYDGSGGLMGAGGAVAAFTETFTPTDLVPKPHQNDQERVEIMLSATSTLLHIYYSNAKSDDEKIEISSINANGVLTNINDL